MLWIAAFTAEEESVMERFKKILVYVETGPDCERLVERACRLAKLHDAELTLVHVIENLPQPLVVELEAAMKLTRKPAVDLQRVFIEDAQRDLDKWVEALHGEGVAASGKLLRGRPYVEIGHEVITGGHQLLMKVGSSNEEDQLFFGPADMRLLRQNPCPVWIIRPRGKRTISTIVAAIDALPSTTTGSALNKRILGLATSLASSEAAELHVVSAWSLYKESRLRARLPASVVAQLGEVTIANTKLGLSRFIGSADAPIADDHVHLRRGHAARVIVDGVEEFAADLLILGTLTHTGIPAFQMGNTADAVLRQVTCSVLAVKPSDYVPPLLRFREMGLLDA
ncbi:MAG: hypothetical protein DWQ31_03490 [Planctomycetota bacterium]|nr:MAG: hypothetical protein DWQ31_03490 [Planctomycetota bacterium]REK46731.1 MAG: hypothetical protein DWQ46_05890 [Planctomycetota bacterium]